MTGDEEQRSSPAGGALEDEPQNDEALRALLKRAVAEERADAPDVLAGFQRKLRERSGGKFYEEGWSTERHPPTMTYLITSLLMLAVLFVIYLVLSPLVGEAHEVDMTPQPVQLLPMPRSSR